MKVKNKIVGAILVLNGALTLASCGEKPKPSDSIGSIGNVTESTKPSESSSSKPSESSTTKPSDSSTTKPSDSSTTKPSDSSSSKPSESDPLLSVKTNAINEVKAYADDAWASIYNNETRKEITNISDKASDAINAATTEDAITKLVSDAKADMDDKVNILKETLFKVKFSGETEVSVKYANKVTEITPAPRSGYEFVGWYQNASLTTKFDFNNLIYDNIILYAKWIKEGAGSDAPLNASGSVSKEGSVAVREVSGNSESAYIKFLKTSGEEYNIYLKGQNDADYRLLDESMVYQRSVDSSTIRADILGISAGNYSVMIAPKSSDTNPTICDIAVIAYDRSGYAHFNYTSGVGAYNDDGTLKDNAVVLYVTDENKNSVELSYKGTTVKGIGNILNSVGADVGGGKCANGGTANSNAGIIKKLGEDNIPLVVRFVGCVSNSGLKKKGVFDAASTPQIEGLTIYNSTGNGGTAGDNGHMARIKSGKDITLEGVGSDAIIDGWGFHFMAESSSPKLGKSFELRNVTFINTPEDAVGMEGVQVSANASSELSASVERCWIHNNEFYGPTISNAAEGDKSEGDGSCDFKRGQYLTVSYNYFEGCHKTNLVGSSDSSLQYNLTYHHNYWKLCKARGPLARRANIHMYNNVFEGQTDYAVNTRADSYIFTEYNLFYTCKNPFRVDGGAIKSYNDSVSSALYQKGGQTVVESKDQIVANNCKFIAKNIDYSKFDTDSTLSYIPSGDYELQTNVTEARMVIKAYGGVRKDNPVAVKNVAMSDLSYLPKSVNPNKITTMPTTLTPGKISKTVYAFTLTNSAKVTISYASDDFTTTGVLVNEAGVCLLTASGSVTLEPGTYMIQPVNFQPGDSAEMTSATFKEITINSISFEKYDSDQYNQKLLAKFNEAMDKVLEGEIFYNDKSKEIIVDAMNAYDALNDELKVSVEELYQKLLTAKGQYIANGIGYVRNLIIAIGTVNEESGTQIALARSEYNKLIEFDSSIVVDNYDRLVAAEDEFATYAVTSCINKIKAIGNVSLDSNEAINLALNEYNALSSDDKAKVTNYADLEAAINEYHILKNVNDFMSILNGEASAQEKIQSYNALTNEEKARLDNETLNSVSNLKVNYTISLIADIGEVNPNSSAKISKARNAYDSLTDEEKAKVTNYDILVKAENDYNDVAVEHEIVSFGGSGEAFSEEKFTLTNANSGTTSGASQVHSGNPVIIVSKFKISGLSKIIVNASFGDKGSSNVEVFYSLDGTNYVSLGSKKASKNNAATELEFAPASYIEGEVYIKIVASCSKGSSNAKAITINSVKIYGYGSMKNE